MIKSSTKKAILDYLMEGNRLTPIEALLRFNCLRLAAAVYDLREEGHDVKTEMIHNKETGKIYARYFIEKKEEKA